MSKAEEIRTSLGEIATRMLHTMGPWSLIVRMTSEEVFAFGVGDLPNLTAELEDDSGLRFAWPDYTNLMPYSKIESLALANEAATVIVRHSYA